jgi:hypothetical protein
LPQNVYIYKACDAAKFKNTVFLKNTFQYLPGPPVNSTQTPEASFSGICDKAAQLRPFIPSCTTVRRTSDLETASQFGKNGKTYAIIFLLYILFSKLRCRSLTEN